jgi:hypothetical protein
MSGGAPNSPVHHRTVTVVVRCVISFQIRSIQPLVLGVGWCTGHCLVHTGQSAVPNRPSLRATRRPRIARPTVGAGYRWLTGQSRAPPDSPVNYSHTPSAFSREQPVHRRSAWRTGHCLVHHRTVQCAWPELVLAAHSQLFFLFYSSSFVTVYST